MVDGPDKPPLVVIEDTREPPREVHPWRVWSPRVVVVRRKLDAGDFGVLPLGVDPGDVDAVVPLPVAVERKALPDLVACCTHERERFEACLARLGELAAAVVIVEATEADVTAHCYRSLCAPSAALASARAFAIDYRVAWWWAGWPDRACQLAEWFLARAARKAKEREQGTT